MNAIKLLLVCFLALLLMPKLLAGNELNPTVNIIVNEGADYKWNRLLTQNLPTTAEWVEHTVSFTSPHAGRVQFLINSTGGVSWLDALSTEGATLNNGDFELIGEDGQPTGWMPGKVKMTIIKDKSLAKQGEAFVKVGKPYIQQWFVVEANKPVTLKISIKRATPAETDEALTSQAPSAQTNPKTKTSGQSSGVVMSNAVECSPRAGLANFFAKCEKGGPVKIAYLGGSITSQSGWRIQSRELLQSQYPQAKIEEIYAAIGGTGADLGVFRLERDVLQHKPDLVFVEFASNGGNRQNMEGIVRSIWQALPDCDICYVYTVAGAESQRLLEQGKLNKNASVFESVAAHYNIPSIHMGIEAAKLAREGKLEWKAPNVKMDQVAGKELDKSSGVKLNADGKIPFAGDGVHPYTDTGHKLYTAAIERSLPSIKAAGGAAKAHTPIPAPMSDDYIRNVSFLEVNDATMTGDWTKVANPGSVYRGYVTNGPSDFERFLPSVWSGKPGASLNFKFKGKTLMLYALYGPGTGRIEIVIDDKKEVRTLFDRYSSVWRLSPAFFYTGSSPDTEHTVKITVLDGGLDKRSIFGKAGLAQKFDNSSATYEPTNLVIGGICIEGGTIVK